MNQNFSIDGIKGNVDDPGVKKDDNFPSDYLPSPVFRSFTLVMNGSNGSLKFSPFSLKLFSCACINFQSRRVFSSPQYLGTQFPTCV